MLSDKIWYQLMNNYLEEIWTEEMKVYCDEAIRQRQEYLDQIKDKLDDLD